MKFFVIIFYHLIIIIIINIIIIRKLFFLNKIVFKKQDLIKFLIFNRLTIIIKLLKELLLNILSVQVNKNFIGNLSIVFNINLKKK